MNQVTLWNPKSALLSENLEIPKIGKKKKNVLQNIFESFECGESHCDGKTGRGHI